MLVSTYLNSVLAQIVCWWAIKQETLQGGWEVSIVFKAHHQVCFRNAFCIHTACHWWNLESIELEKPSKYDEYYERKREEKHSLLFCSVILNSDVHCAIREEYRDIIETRFHVMTFLRIRRRHQQSDRLEWRLQRLHFTCQILRVSLGETSCHHHFLCLTIFLQFWCF